MTLHVDNSILSAALAGLVPLAVGATPQHEAVVLDATADGRLRLSAGLSLSGWASVPANVITPGRVAVNAARLAAVVKAGGGAVILLRGDERNRVVIECGGKYTLNGDDPADVPSPPVLDAAESVDLPGPDLATAIDTVAACVSPDDNRYGLNVAHLEAEGAAARIVATDGNRLAYAPLPVPAKVDLPRAFVVALRRLLGDGAVTLRWTRQRVGADTDTWGLSSPRQVVEFPDYRQVLPTTHKLAVTLPAAELAAAVARVRPLARDAFHSLRLDIGADGLILTAKSTDIGTATATVDAEVVGEPMAVGMNAAFLTDAMRVFGSATVTLRFVNALGPITITSPERDGVLLVLMPLRLD